MSSTHESSGSPAQLLSRNGLDRRPQGRVTGPLEAVLDRARRHPVLSHPWLRDFAAGDLPDPRRALRDFARHHRLYSDWFPTYLQTVIGRLESPRQRDRLARNLAEERGRLDPGELAALRAAGIEPDWVDGVPHPELFRRFCRAVGLRDDAAEETTAVAARWRLDFQRFLASASPPAAVGALGPGTEGVVARLYAEILRGLRRFEWLSPYDRVFFDLHCIVDDQHQADLLAIARELACDDWARREVWRGALAALEMRGALFDALYSRARNPEWASVA